LLKDWLNIIQENKVWLVGVESAIVGRFRERGEKQRKLEMGGAETVKVIFTTEDTKDTKKKLKPRALHIFVENMNSLKTPTRMARKPSLGRFC